MLLPGHAKAAAVCKFEPTAVAGCDSCGLFIIMQRADFFVVIVVI